MITEATDTYRSRLHELRSEARTMMVFMSNFGGSTIDCVELREFWDRLRPDLPDDTHRSLTSAWLATCAFPKDADRERGVIREFIETTALRQGWMAGN
jgi:hypothetical protein